jgi:hypothetical protein
MAITAKPYKFLNQQTNLPVAGFTAISTPGILNQSHGQSSGVLGSLSSTLCSVENSVSSALSSVGNMITSAESIVGGALSAVGSGINSVMSDIGSMINGLSCSNSSLTPSSTSYAGAMTSGLSNVGNSSGNVFSQGSNLGSGGIGSLILAPASQIANSATSIISGLGQNASYGLSSFTSQCLNQLLNNLNQACNFNSNGMGNFGNNGGFGCVGALSGLLGSIVGNPSQFGVPNTCNDYRALVGLTETSTQAGIMGVFSPLASTINNPAATNAAGPTLFQYGTQNQSFGLVSDLSTSPAVGSISSSIPNAASLISQSYNSGLSSNSQSMAGTADLYDSVLTAYNPSALTGNIGGAAIPSISNLLASPPSPSSLLQSTMRGSLTKSSLVNSSISSVTRTPLGSVLGAKSNNTGSSQSILNPLSQQNMNAANSVLGNSPSTSTANVGIGSGVFNTGSSTSTASSASSTTTTVASTSVQTNTGYTTISSGPAATTTQSSSSQSSYQSNVSAASSVLGGSSSGSSSGSLTSTMYAAASAQGSTSSMSQTTSSVGTTNSSIVSSYRSRTLNKSVDIASVVSNPTAPPAALSANDHMYMAMQAVSQVV